LPVQPKTYSTAGWYEARLEVTDEFGLRCTDSARIVALAPGKGLPPEILTAPITSTQCGALYPYSQSLTPKASGGGTKTWTAATAPAGFTIDQTTGAISWLPLPEQRGFHTVALQAQSENGIDVQTYSVEVTCPDKLALGTSCTGCGMGGNPVPFGLLLLFGLGRLGRRKKAQHAS
jgi:MYXO-CTERM domain-containing protein